MPTLTISFNLAQGEDFQRLASSVAHYVAYHVNQKVNESIHPTRFFAVNYNVVLACVGQSDDYGRIREVATSALADIGVDVEVIVQEREPGDIANLGHGEGISLGHLIPTWPREGADEVAEITIPGEPNGTQFTDPNFYSLSYLRYNHESGFLDQVKDVWRAMLTTCCGKRYLKDERLSRYYDQVKHVWGAVCKICCETNGVPHSGTGFLVLVGGAYKIYTNWHVVNDVSKESITLIFDYDAADSECNVAQPDKIEYIGESSHDYAVLSVNHEKFDFVVGRDTFTFPNYANVTHQNQQAGEWVMIGHPRGAPKRLSVVSDETGFHPLGVAALYNTTRSRPGNSGSPVIFLGTGRVEVVEYIHYAGDTSYGRGVSLYSVNAAIRKMNTPANRAVQE